MKEAFDVVISSQNQTLNQSHAAANTAQNSRLVWYGDAVFSKPLWTIIVTSCMSSFHTVLWQSQLGDKRSIWPVTACYSHLQVSAFGDPVRSRPTKRNRVVFLCARARVSVCVCELFQLEVCYITTSLFIESSRCFNARMSLLLPQTTYAGLPASTSSQISKTRRLDRVPRARLEICWPHVIRTDAFVKVGLTKNL